LPSGARCHRVSITFLPLIDLDKAIALEAYFRLAQNVDRTQNETILINALQLGPARAQQHLGRVGRAPWCRLPRLGGYSAGEQRRERCPPSSRGDQDPGRLAHNGEENSAATDPPRAEEGDIVRHNGGWLKPWRKGHSPRH
jgi:hypothetical protein